MKLKASFEVRDALRKAADSIEKMGKWRFGEVGIPQKDECNTPYCALGWISAQLGHDNMNCGYHACIDQMFDEEFGPQALLLNHRRNEAVDEVYALIRKCSGINTYKPGAAGLGDHSWQDVVRGLRSLADEWPVPGEKDYPRKKAGIPDEVRALFKPRVGVKS